MCESRPARFPIIRKLSVKMDVPSDASSDVSPASALPVRAAVDNGDTGEEHALQPLVGRLSHRLLGLVNSIEGYTDMLAHTLGTEEQRELSQRILEGTTRIERVIHSLRRFSEPIDPVVRVVTARQLVDGLRELVGPKRWRRVEVEWSVAERSHELMGDPVLVRQALLVLVQNAFEATSECAIRLEISADAETRCTRFVVWNEGQIELSEPHERIFEPFFSTKGPNLGLGLPLARRIAEAHAGTLELVHTDADAGTSFAMELPHPGEEAADQLMLRR